MRFKADTWPRWLIDVVSDIAHCIILMHGISERPTTTVLIVDDEVPVRNLVVKILRKAAYEVLTAGTAEEALEILKVKHVDVVLTDHHLPDGDGATLAKDILARWPNVKTALCSGGGRPVSAPSDLRYLAKPFSIEELLSFIESLRNAQP